jgi:Sel1 repeat
MTATRQSPARRAPILAGFLSVLISIPAAFAAAPSDASVPRDVPRHAAEALALAQKWQRDAILIDVRTRQSMNYALEFGFRSASTQGRFSASYAGGRMTSQVDAPVSASDGGAIPLAFIDLPAALAQARQKGMSSAIKEATLDVSHPGGGTALTWSIQADTDHPPYEFDIAATAGAPPGNTVFRAPVVASNAAPAAPMTAAAPPPLPVHVVTPSAAAEALWQKGSAFYDRKDYRDALATYQQAAALGHPRATAVLGNMYREGEGVPKNPSQAIKWYVPAAAAGNRGAQFSLGSMYEEGEGIAKDVAKAAQLYEASARQGMPEAQFALGLSYEFGEGVPRNRRTAIFWLDQVAKQGDGRAKWYADWLSRPDTPQFQDEGALGRYVDGKVNQRMWSQMHAGDRAPILGQAERNARASDFEMQGDNNRAASCRANGPC